MSVPWLAWLSQPPIGAKCQDDLTKVEVRIDDARHYMLTSREKFDAVTSDPLDPWVKGAATLYTREYFELCKKRLNPGGVITQWVPLYESNAEAVKSEVATFFEVFPEGSVWGNDQGGYGYDTVLLGQVEANERAGRNAVSTSPLDEGQRRATPPWEGPAIPAGDVVNDEAHVGVLGERQREADVAPAGIRRRRI